MPFIPANKIKTIHIPTIQIMGLDFALYVLSLVDKQVYAVQVTYECTYPRTLHELRNQ
ncbi:hypothetical protein BC941DRAFT_352799 [Chlamydoabsidia padenii]|nr:hypothetical protein BC941DRAFT_352799 [Chlamydoabsidia padenii]